MKTALVSDLLQAAAAQLAAAGIDHADYEAKALIGHVLGLSLSEVERVVIMGHDFPADRPTALAALVGRRVRREPLQHILGTAPFRYLELAVGPGVFIPRPETELLVDAALDFLTAGFLAADRLTADSLTTDGLAADGPVTGTAPAATGAAAVDGPATDMTTPARPLRVVDLCAGSGAIGLALLTELAGSRGQDSAGPPDQDGLGPDCQVYAVEKSPQAFVWLERNRAQLPPALGVAYISRLADACEPATLHELDGQVDCVVSNPPYVPESQPPSQPEVAADPTMALFGGSPDGLAIPERIVDRAAQLLRPGGLLVMEHDQTQAGALVEYCGETGFKQVVSHLDLTGRARYITAFASEQCK